MAKQYKVLSGIITKEGKSYRLGTVIELTEDQAKRMGSRVEEFKVTDKTDAAELDRTDVNAEDLTMDQLKSIVERDGLEVVGTGKNGAIKKEDYITALEK